VRFLSQFLPTVALVPLFCMVDEWPNLPYILLFSWEPRSFLCRWQPRLPNIGLIKQSNTHCFCPLVHRSATRHLRNSECFFMEIFIDTEHLRHTLALFQSTCNVNSSFFAPDRHQSTRSFCWTITSAIICAGECSVKLSKWQRYVPCHRYHVKCRVLYYDYPDKNANYTFSRVESNVPTKPKGAPTFSVPLHDPQTNSL